MVENLERVCKKKPKFMNKSVQLGPSFPEKYESSTETELDADEQPDLKVPNYDSDCSIGELDHVSEFLKTGRTQIT